MPLYGTPQAGSNTTDLGKNLSAICVGDTYVLFDGTETPEEGETSIAMARATQGSSDNGISFFAGGIPGDMILGIQAANQDIDADYVTLAQMDGANGPTAAYTDIGRAPFWRAIILVGSSASPAVMPRVTVER
jgi:hypothetical protein